MKPRDESELLRAAERAAEGGALDSQPVTGDGVLISRLRRLSQISRLASAYRALGQRPDLPEGGLPGSQGAPLFRWGPFQVLEKLGEGSFGEVYRAWDPSLQREVALKLRRATTERAPRLIEEARGLARVRHPNVLTVHGAALHEGRLGLWTDLVRGRTLVEWLTEHGLMGPREAALIGLDLLRALAGLHAAGLLHGDLKASNVMRESAPTGSEASGAGRIVLMDFGARRCTSGSNPVAAIGTPLAMAPEVLRGAPESVASDIYSLGVLLYWLVTGAYPVEADSLEGLVDKHLRGERRPLRDRRPELPTAFVQVIEKALAPEPAQRYGSAGEMEASLVAALEPSARTVAARGRHKVAIGLAAALAAVLLVSAIIWIGRARQERGPDGPTPREAVTPPAEEQAGGSRTGLAVSEPFSRDRQAGAASAGRRKQAEGMASSAPPIEVALHQARDGLQAALSSGSRVRPGDHLFMAVECSEPLHLYVLNDDAAGSVFVLFPVPGVDLANPLVPNVSYRLPGRLDGRPFDWVVSSAGGRERFLVVASRQPLGGLEQAIALIEPAKPGRPVAFAQLDQEAMGTLRGVGGMEAAAPTSTPSGGRLERLARDLERQARERGGLWVHQIELESVAP